MSPLVLEMPQGVVSFRTLVLDFTGTLSEDGQLLSGVSQRLRTLAGDLRILVLTADTFGTAREAMDELPAEVRVIRDGREKAQVVSDLGPESVIAVGNGRNDIPMMKVAGLGIAVVGPEGAASGVVPAADVLTRDIREALDLLLHPLRLKATLRD
jgi:soluble P-type ATPase